jgi:hypothetical protein
MLSFNNSRRVKSGLTTELGDRTKAFDVIVCEIP